MLKVALIGCGAIGRVIAGAIAKGEVDASLEMVFDMDRESAETVCALFDKAPDIAGGINDILESDATMVVEAASVRAAKEVTLPVLESGKDIMLLSAGVLADEDFVEKVREIARESRGRVHIPSGAIVGLDGLKSAMSAEVAEVTLTTTKPPSGLAGAPYLFEEGIVPEDIKEKTVIFQGSAREAIKAFPANVNVAVSLATAGIGVDRTKVKVVADPGTTRNTHEIHVKGDFGEFTIKVENLPSPHNPRTSYLAALSAIATLKKIATPIQIGT